MPAKSSFPLCAALLTPLLALATYSAAGRGAQNTLPAGAGKETVERVCIGCHEIDTVIGVRRTRPGWQEMVDEMASRGAAGSSQELASVVQYLAEFFGKINVNTASAKEMGRFLGIGDADAESIVNYRGEPADFKNLVQVKKTPGVNAEKLQEKRDLICIQSIGWISD